MAAKAPFLAPNAAVRNVVDAIRSFDEPAVSTGMYFHPNAAGQRELEEGVVSMLGGGRPPVRAKADRELRRKGREEGRTCAHGGLAEATPPLRSLRPAVYRPHDRPDKWNRDQRSDEHRSAHASRDRPGGSRQGRGLPSGWPALTVVTRRTRGRSCDQPAIGQRHSGEAHSRHGTCPHDGTAGSGKVARERRWQKRNMGDERHTMIRNICRTSTPKTTNTGDRSAVRSVAPVLLMVGSLLAASMQTASAAPPGCRPLSADRLGQAKSVPAVAQERSRGAGRPETGASERGRADLYLQQLPDGGNRAGVRLRQLHRPPDPADRSGLAPQVLARPAPW